MDRHVDVAQRFVYRVIANARFKLLDGVQNRPEIARADHAASVVNLLRHR
jgi:hypothetical protein